MRKRFSTCLGVALLSCMLLGNRVAFANVRPTAEEFPEKTIIIGTYAIVLDVVNEELLELALQSAETNMQNEVYFKSDINSGIWYNITNSDSISDISESTANIVKNQEIDKLYLTHYTNASGVTISFLTNRQVYVSDIDTPQVPTNIVELDELENELKIQQALYDSVKDEPEEETEKEKDKRLDKKAIYSQKINSLNEVLKTIEHKEIAKLTAQIHAVENLERELVKKGADSAKIEMVVSQKENLKNTRMAYCYQILIDKMNKENVSIDYEDCNDLIQKYAGAITSLESILSELGIAIDKVASTIGDENNIDETFSENQSSEEVLEEEAIGVNKIIEENLELMLEYAESGNFEKAEEALEEAYVAETVKNNDNNVSEEVKEKQKEVLQQAIELLEQEALELVQAGDGKDYKEAVKNKESNTVLEAIKEETISNLSELLAQLEDTYASLSEKTEGAKEQASLLQEKTKAYENLLSAIPICEVRESIKELLQEELDDTKEQLNEIKLQAIPEYQETVAVVESTEKQIETLNEKYLEAVEENNTEDSNQYKMELENAVNGLVSAENKLEQLEKEFMEGNLKSELELEETTSTEDLKEKKEDILKELEGILSGEDSIDAISDLLENLKQVENESILSFQKLEDSNDILRETKNVLEESLADLENLLRLTQEDDKTSLLKEELQQTKETIEYLEDLLTFVEETKQKVEKKLQVTTNSSQQTTILSDTIKDYKEKLKEIENVLQKEMQDGIKGAVQKEIEQLEQQIKTIQTNEKREDSLNKLEQKIEKEETTLDKISDLVNAFVDVEMLRLENVTDLAEAITYVEESLSDLKKLSQMQEVTEEEKELLQKEVHQLEDNKQCLEEYLEFIEEKSQELEQKLQKITTPLQQVTILSDAIEDYKEKLEEIENNILQKEVQDSIKGAVQKEIEQLEQQIEIIQTNEKREDSLNKLEQGIKKEETTVAQISDLVSAFTDIEMLRLEEVTDLAKAITYVEEALTDLGKLSQMAGTTEEEKEVLQQESQQLEDKKQCLEEYLEFIKEKKEELEQKLQETTTPVQKVTALSNAIEDYKEKLEEIETILQKEVQDSIKGAVQKEIEQLEQQIEAIQTEDKREDSLDKLEEGIKKEEDEISDLVSAFTDIEMLRLEEVMDLVEAITYVEESLSDLRDLSQMQGVTEEEKEVLQQELQQLEDNKQCLEEYLEFIKEQKEEIEQKLQKITTPLQQETVLSDGIDMYQEKWNSVETTLQKEVQNCIKTALQKEMDTLEIQLTLLQVEDKKDAMLQELEQVISKKDDSLERVSDLVDNFNEIEKLSLKQAQTLEEAIDVKEEVLSDFEKLLQGADIKKEGTNRIEEKIQQIKEEVDLLKEYVAFIENTNQTLEKQLEKTTDLFEHKELLSNEKDSYKEKVDNVENSLETVNSEDSSLKEELKQCIVTALQEEISDITKQEQEIQKKIEERLEEILGDKSELSAENKALAQAQEEKYSEEELNAIAIVTDSLREAYAKKGAELMYPWLIIFKEYDVKLTLPAIKLKDEIYVPVEEVAIQLGAEVLTSKTNDVIIIKGRNVLIEYILNDNIVYVNDKKMMVTLSPAKEIKNQVYISLQCFVRAYRLEEATYSDYTVLSEK